MLLACPSSDFTPTYEISCLGNNLIAQIGSKKNDFWLKILRSKEEILLEEIYNTDYEVDIENVEWNEKCTIFAVKLIGYDDWTQIKLFSTKGEKTIIISKKIQLVKYKWLSLDLNYTVKDKPYDMLDKYKI